MPGTRFQVNNQIDMFYNTINLLPSEKATKEVKASKQNDVILEFFKINPDKDFTPFEVWGHFDKRWPITSVRRAITTLTKMGVLIKTDAMRLGMYGEKNYCWRIKL